jgi:16S rRNA (cytidine1402-2'-O)-methyltransferase
MTHQSNSGLISSAILDKLAQQTYPSSALYVLATPIGNICDITLRALHVISIADVVACEDTRNTGYLLSCYGLSKILIAVHKYNEKKIAEKIVDRLKAGERIVLVCDSGTPTISDPGARIVDAALRAGLRTVPVPGPSATIAALSVSGTTNDQFQFIGFLPSKAQQREALLDGLKRSTSTLLIYETPHRIIESVNALLKVFGPSRQITFARELTKLFENIHRCSLKDAMTWLTASSYQQRGEFVLIVEAAAISKSAIPLDENFEEGRVLQILLTELSIKKSVDLAAKITKQRRKILYEYALKLKNE